jgi:hypothetical protein
MLRWNQTRSAAHAKPAGGALGVNILTLLAAAPPFQPQFFTPDPDHMRCISKVSPSLPAKVVTSATEAA